MHQKINLFGIIPSSIAVGYAAASIHKVGELYRDLLAPSIAASHRILLMEASEKRPIPVYKMHSFNLMVTHFQTWTVTSHCMHTASNYM